MGFAKAAELNGYPGPRHVLDLAAQLSLTPDQRQQVQAIFDRMSAAAKPLGAELVERERVLDQLFQKGDINPDRLVAETAAIAELQGRLRSVHLSAHLETRALLTADQIATYERLRGYGGRGAPPHPSSSITAILCIRQRLRQLEKLATGRLGHCVIEAEEVKRFGSSPPWRFTRYFCRLREVRSLLAPPPQARPSPIASGSPSCHLILGIEQTFV